MVGFERKVARRSPNILKMLSAKANNTTDLIYLLPFSRVQSRVVRLWHRERSIAFRLFGSWPRLIRNSCQGGVGALLY